MEWRQRQLYFIRVHEVQGYGTAGTTNIIYMRIIKKIEEKWYQDFLKSLEGPKKMTQIRLQKFPSNPSSALLNN